MTFTTTAITTITTVITIQKIWKLLCKSINMKTKRNREGIWRGEISKIERKHRKIISYSSKYKYYATATSTTFLHLNTNSTTTVRLQRDMKQREISPPCTVYSYYYCYTASLCLYRYFSNFGFDGGSSPSSKISAHCFIPFLSNLFGIFIKCH